MAAPPDSTYASRDLLAFSPGLRLRFYRLAFLIAETLPLWLLRWFAYTVGVIAWTIDPKGRRKVARNLAPLLPPDNSETLSRTVRRNFICFSMSVAEAFAMGRMPKARFKEPWLTIVDPWGVFQERPRREATIFATVHCNWELAIAVYHHLDLINGCDAIALSHGDPGIDTLFDTMRGRFRCKSLLLDRAPLAALRSLKDGRHLATVGERDYRGTGLPVIFAGQPTRMPVGPAALAVQTGAPIVPCMLARRSFERFVLMVGRPLRADPDLGKNLQVQSLTQHLADRFTRFLAAVPAQWVAFHDSRSPSRESEKTSPPANGQG